MSHRLSLFTIFLLCIMPASRAWGWGCTGHEVVALIALKAMRPEVATQVEALLAAQDHNYQGRFCSDLGLDPIAYYATWADDFRASTAGASTAPWHFWDVPLSRKTAADTEFCDQGCVTHALREQLAILSDNTQDATKRGEALKSSFTSSATCISRCTSRTIMIAEATASRPTFCNTIPERRTRRREAILPIFTVFGTRSCLKTLAA